MHLKPVTAIATQPIEFPPIPLELDGKLLHVIKVLRTKGSVVNIESCDNDGLLSIKALAVALAYDINFDMPHS